jgi:hypothetical protein
VINGETMMIYDAEVEATMQLSTEMKNLAQSTTAASVHANPGQADGKRTFWCTDGEGDGEL